MTNSNIISNFFRHVIRPPPVIHADRPLASEVTQMLDAMQLMTSHLYELPSFRTRYAIVEPEWTRIWLWLVALLKPLDAFTPAQSASQELPLTTASRCLMEVFSLLNSIASPTQTSPAEFDYFVNKMLKHHETSRTLAKVWVVSFTRQWSLSVYYPMMQFLIALHSTVGEDSSDHSFHLAVRNAFPNLQLLPTWSAAVEDLCGQQAPSHYPNPDHRFVTANRGMVLAATTFYFQPLPALDNVHIILTQAYALWTQYLDTPRSYLENNCTMSVHCIARFFLRLITTGGPNWMVKALDAKLLYLLAKTLAWNQTGPQSKSESSMFEIVKKILHALLIHSVYRPVWRRIRRNLRDVRSENIQDYLGAGNSWKLWVDLAREFHILPKGLKGGMYKRETHPMNYPPDDTRPMISELAQVQLLFRGLLQAIACRDEIRHSIRAQGLQSSRIVIEFNLTCNPWTWKVYRLVWSDKSQSFLTKFGFRRHHDTVFAIICPVTMKLTKYVARSIHRMALLDFHHEGNKPSKDCLFHMLDDIIRH
ncbi:uncharacterized protein C8R40DRAFT_1071972 [Lentinula edodes]|uniref:uncharacterized protein n=1 Tax=Lentinula edodes TaxID=5353 RepID=UPI001E8ECB97|nr:uncharacterized protein C8R40DRAFT_1071972 [Lentinula edodes]KAH7872199.1 hypothetical protein C8R40DRAFT_1071972 [Lentinula edodes]